MSYRVCSLYTAAACDPLPVTGPLTLDAAIADLLTREVSGNDDWVIVGEDGERIDWYDPRVRPLWDDEGCE